MTREIKIPTILAFEKKLVPSDGFIYETTWENRYEENKSKALKLIQKTVRGTISNRLKSAQTKDKTKINATIENANIQTVDNCALSVDQDSLKLKFTLKILGGIGKASACNNADFALHYAKAVENYIAEEGFTELAKRYATNIANARFLWRNRVGAEAIEVLVQQVGTNAKWKFENSEKIGLKDFNHNNSQIIELGNKIAEALSDKIPYLLLEIIAFAKIGKAQDVYPSEEFVLDKENRKDKKSKILYDVNGNAAMHSQKIGNAIRTIDNWYPLENLADKLPIAVEPYGSVTNLGVAYRTPSDKSDFFTLFDKKFTQRALTKEERHYVMAVLVRGGVFGKSGKEKVNSE